MCSGYLLALHIKSIANSTVVTFKFTIFAACLMQRGTRSDRIRFKDPQYNAHNCSVSSLHSMLVLTKYCGWDFFQCLATKIFPSKSSTKPEAMLIQL